jgi:hypothetical protein
MNVRQGRAHLVRGPALIATFGLDERRQQVVFSPIDSGTNSLTGGKMDPREQKLAKKDHPLRGNQTQTLQ